MKSILAFAILGAAMAICGIGDKADSGAANTDKTTMLFIAKRSAFANEWRIRHFTFSRA